MSVTVNSECAHCAEPMTLEVDSDVECRVGSEGAEPVVFFPMVDFSKLTERCITDVF